MSRQAVLAAAAEAEAVPGALLCFGCGEMVPPAVYAREFNSWRPGRVSDEVAYKLGFHWNDEGGGHTMSSEAYPEDGRVRRIQELTKALAEAKRFDRIDSSLDLLRRAEDNSRRFMAVVNPWLLLTKYRIERCKCGPRSCGKWKIREFTSGESVYPHEWDSWEQAIDEVRRRQTRQYHGFMR